MSPYIIRDLIILIIFGTTAAFADDTAIVATDSDPAIASHILQTNLLAIQNLFKN
jgi:hypothetical protein